MRPWAARSADPPGAGPTPWQPRWARAVRRAQSVAAVTRWHPARRWRPAARTAAPPVRIPLPRARAAAAAARARVRAPRPPPRGWGRAPAAADRRAAAPTTQPRRPVARAAVRETAPRQVRAPAG